MPLPSGGAWPPPEHADALATMAVHRAWWTGSAAELTKAYARPINRPSQYRGGIVGVVARTFWGKPTSSGEAQSKTHVPVAADVATLSADLLFSDPPKITVDDEATKARIEEYIEDGLWSAMREGAEAAAALSGTYIRVVWDKSISDKPWLACVDADCAIPEFRWDRLAAVTFWHVVERTTDRVVRLLERHEPGKILYGVYDGTETDLGRRVPLTDYDVTASLAASLTGGDEIATGVDMLTAFYVPNMRPNKVTRLPLGRSDFAGIESLMDELDEVMTSWMRDIRLAKARLMVPESMLESLGAGNGAMFDSERELLLGVTGLDPMATSPTLFQPAIRFAEHQATAQARIEAIVRGAGYSMATFSPSAESGTAVTASEIKQREKRSLTTRGRKIGYWLPALAGAIEALLAIDAAHFGASVKVQKPSVVFPDAVSEDPAEVARTLQLLDQAKAMSTEAKVELLHPDWDEEQVAEEVAALMGGALEQRAAGLKAVADLAVSLGKAVSTGGLADTTAQQIIELVLSEAVDEDGTPIDVGPADFAGSPEPAVVPPGAAGGLGGPPRPAGPAGRPGPPGNGTAQPARGR